MKPKNNTEVRKAYLRFAGYLTCCIILAVTIFACFLKTSGIEVKRITPEHTVSGLEDKTIFLRLGNAPFGNDSKVLRPISMVFPVVNALKRFKSFGNQKRSLFSKPIAMRRSTAAMQLLDSLISA